jgi:tRNA-splicing ligase RtcB
VIPTEAAIIARAVGVDIGCGMIALRTDLAAKDLPDSLARLRARIEARIRVGFNHHDSPLNPLHDGLRGRGLVNAAKQAPNKDVDTVMTAQTNLVEVAHTLKQVMCIKG